MVPHVSKFIFDQCFNWKLERDLVMRNPTRNKKTTHTFCTENGTTVPWWQCRRRKGDGGAAFF